MPEVQQSNRVPYESSKKCVICHVAPKMTCLVERTHKGTTVVRHLECPNCGATDTDLFDLRTETTVFDHAMDISAARNVGAQRGRDVG